VHGNHQIRIRSGNGFLERLETGAPRDDFLQPGSHRKNPVVPKEAPQGRVVLEHPVERHYLVVRPHAVVCPHVHNFALTSNGSSSSSSNFGEGDDNRSQKRTKIMSTVMEAAMMF
jgi:hypothetical protein